MACAARLEQLRAAAAAGGAPAAEPVNVRNLLLAPGSAAAAADGAGGGGGAVAEAAAATVTGLSADMRSLGLAMAQARYATGGLLVAAPASPAEAAAGTARNVRLTAQPNFSYGWQARATGAAYAAPACAAGSSAVQLQHAMAQPANCSLNAVCVPRKPSDASSNASAPFALPEPATAAGGAAGTLNVGSVAATAAAAAANAALDTNPTLLQWARLQSQRSVVSGRLVAAGAAGAHNQVPAALLSGDAVQRSLAGARNSGNQPAPSASHSGGASEQSAPKARKRSIATADLEDSGAVEPLNKRLANGGEQRRQLYLGALYGAPPALPAALALPLCVSDGGSEAQSAACGAYPVLLPLDGRFGFFLPSASQGSSGSSSGGAASTSGASPPPSGDGGAASFQQSQKSPDPSAVCNTGHVTARPSPVLQLPAPRPLVPQSPLLAVDPGGGGQPVAAAHINTEAVPGATQQAIGKAAADESEKGVLDGPAAAEAVGCADTDAAPLQHSVKAGSAGATAAEVVEGAIAAVVQRSSGTAASLASVLALLPDDTLAQLLSTRLEALMASGSGDVTADALAGALALQLLQST